MLRTLRARQRRAGARLATLAVVTGAGGVPDPGVLPLLRALARLGALPPATPVVWLAGPDEAMGAALARRDTVGAALARGPRAPLVVRPLGGARVYARRR